MADLWSNPPDLRSVVALPEIQAKRSIPVVAKHAWWSLRRRSPVVLGHRTDQGCRGQCVPEGPVRLPLLLDTHVVAGQGELHPPVFLVLRVVIAVQHGIPVHHAAGGRAV